MADDNDNSNVDEVSIFDPKGDAVEQIKAHIEPGEFLTIRGHEYINKATVQRLLGTSRRGVEKLVSSGKLKQEYSPMPGRKPQCIYLLRKVADIWAVRQRSRLAAIEAGKASVLTLPLGTSGASAFEHMLQRIMDFKANFKEAGTSASIDLSAVEQMLNRVMLEMSTQVAVAVTEAAAKLIEQRLESRLITPAQVRADYGGRLYRWVKAGLEDGTLRNLGTKDNPRVSKYEFELKAGLIHYPNQPPAVLVAHGALAKTEVSGLRAAS